MTDEAEHEPQPQSDQVVDEVVDPSTDGYHEAPTHMDAHTALSDDDHGHGDEALGPIDWGAWSVALLGGAAALVVVALFWVAVS